MPVYIVILLNKKLLKMLFHPLNSDYKQPWEDNLAEYPPNLASPLEILVEASTGASDYGNKFGEPVICGFTRAFGLIDSAGERREWIKPIMFSGGIGAMDAQFAIKEKPEKGTFSILSCTLKTLKLIF